MEHLSHNETLTLYKKDQAFVQESRKKILRTTIAFGMILLLVGWILQASIGLSVSLAVITSVILYSGLRNLKINRPYYIYDYFYNQNMTVKAYHKVDYYDNDGRISYIIETNNHNYFVQGKRGNVMYVCQLMNKKHEMEKDK